MSCVCSHPTLHIMQTRQQLEVASQQAAEVALREEFGSLLPLLLQCYPQLLPSLSQRIESDVEWG